ncbi:cystathionine beta-synthase [Sulfobacillus thermosulfidooxidans DSM 9293]|uniref:Cysteine synthase n=1 Tax=Sulfobacillus thermosulfidooxidans (strain DSM 9293 / VKM B-1269 / AT-1) TaxID=929705 RepID=A0A1W1WLD3_SULTA|nr:cysteine synthase family protein [Sulfobacillus thermosulfidooxidans]SMC06830.1 cystathionine beta-synthase [Sulfobacillus thermosulfidooxidans DSM 9293]
MPDKGSILPNILGAIGHTPLIALQRLVPDNGVRIAVKFEAVNPGGSIKDRIAPALIEVAEREHRLKPGGTIIEATAGNTGIALAMVAAVKGYRALFVVPDKMSADKIAILKAYGAEVKIVPDVGRDDENNYQNVAKRLAEEIPGGCYMGQFEQEANPHAHYMSTGPEIWEQTEGQVRAVVAGAGTGGTITGIGRYLKEKDPNILIIGADPVGSIFTGPVAPFKLEGMGEDYYPQTLDMHVVDRWMAVSDEEAFAMTRRLAREEGILAGGSSGAMVHVALRIAQELNPGDLIVALAPDTGRNYLSSIFYNHGNTDTFSQ